MRFEHGRGSTIASARTARSRLAVALAAVAMTSATLLFLLGCPSNACFLKICHGKDCRCSISSCADGAAFDVRQNRCRCLKGYLLVAGQCLTPALANAYCGVGQHFENGGCAADRCRPGDEIDLNTGMCAPREQVNQVATNIGVQVGQGEKLGCPAGTKLVLDGPKAACVPLSQTCARDETWNGQQCAKNVTCPNGEIWNSAQGRCVAYARGAGSGELVIDVAAWATLNYGPDGGAGTAAFCGGFTKKPWSFGVAEGSSANVRVSIALAFEGNEVARGSLQSVAVFDATNNPVPPKGAADVDAAARSMFAPLVQGGGRSSLASVRTTVRCSITNAAKPQPVPATGGL